MWLTGWTPQPPFCRFALCLSWRKKPCNTDVFVLGRVTLTGTLTRNEKDNAYFIFCFIPRGFEWHPWVEVGWTIWCFVRSLWWCQGVRYHFISPALEIFLWSSRILDCYKRWWQNRIPLGILQVNLAGVFQIKSSNWQQFLELLLNSNFLENLNVISLWDYSSLS